MKTALLKKGKMIRLREGRGEGVIRVNVMDEEKGHSILIESISLYCKYAFDADFRLG